MQRNHSDWKLEQHLMGILALSVLVISLVGIAFTSMQVLGATNVTNQSVLAIVNVSNTEPVIVTVVVDDDLPSPAGEIDLVANNVTVITCNATVFDYNGAPDIEPNDSNATFYIQSVGPLGVTDNNIRYRNESCGRCTLINATHTACDCRMAIQYYANDSSSWLCNMSVTDRGGHQHPSLKLNISSTGVSSTVTVTKLLGISAPAILDYGNLTVTETSNEIIHNVTNVGNVDLNLSLRGYGGTNETLGQNLSMICAFGNISVGQQKYMLGTENVGSSNWSRNMAILRNQTDITNLTLFQRIHDDMFGSDRNSTLWKLRVPLSVGGICNGTIIFGAVEDNR